MRYRGLCVAVEVDGPSHFSRAPPSPLQPRGLFGAAPRRAGAAGRLRELVVRANAGWVVLPLPFFDW